MKGRQAFNHCTWWLASLLALGATACAETGTPAEASSDAIDAGSETVGTAVAGGATDPRVDIDSPLNNKAFPYTDPGNAITVTVSVTNATVSATPGDFQLAYYLNGVEVGVVQDTNAFTVSGVPFGRHHLAVRLLDDAGGELANVESLDGVYVRVLAPCGDAADCDDGNFCSNEACSSGTCAYGPKGSTCCDTVLECQVGQFCEDNACVDCLDSTDCDDGNSCTVDTCGANGACTFTQIAGCCLADADCDDDDYCTSDTCNTATSTCEFEASDDPFCCNTSADCIPTDPCVSAYCKHIDIIDYHKCRFGPPAPGCCTEDAGCDDGNPCTLDQCDIAGGEATGQCSYPADPTKPNCCLSNAECDDGDPATLDACVADACEYTVNPNYCDLPSTSMIVINELMPAPGGVVDTAGEWFEIFNASGGVVDVTGWIVEIEHDTGLVQTHTLVVENSASGAVGMQILPGGYWVLGASNLATENGGYYPHYTYGVGVLTMPDPFEDGLPHLTTIRIKNPAGGLIDEVTFNENWPLQDRRSMELINPYLDNGVATSWRTSGENTNPTLNKRYGFSSFDLYATPKYGNESSFAHVTPASAGQCGSLATGTCGEARCGLDSQCVITDIAGCCEADSDCNDFSLCTIDSCDLATNTCAEPDISPDCCQTNTDCNDGNPCNIDRCLGNQCRYSPNVFPNCCTADEMCEDGDVCTVNACDVLASECTTPLPVVLADGKQCCNNHLECDDGDPATFNTCLGEEDFCIFPLNPNYCDSPDDACDDGLVCTTDFCDTSANTCVHNLQPACCQSNAECPDDGNPCTASVCDVTTGLCQQDTVDGCCATSSECDDGDACTQNICTNNQCHFLPLSGCCSDASDCDDGLPCTLDSCNAGACTNEATEACCTVGASPTVLLDECGPDPDGPATCFVWECLPGGVCELAQNATCCTSNAECNDSDDCTFDFCLTNNTCKHFVINNGVCCDDNADCSDQDGNSCTAPFCDGGTCSEVPIGGCVQGVNPTVDGGPHGPGLTPFEAESASCWVGSVAGPLGGDVAATCDADTGATGDSGVLSSLGFNPSGEFEVTVQFKAAWDAGAGNHALHVLGSAVEGDFTGAETLMVIPMSGEQDGTLQTILLSNFLLVQSKVYVGFKVVTDAPQNLVVHVDDFRVGSGQAPFFVSALSTSKVYDRDTQRLDDAGTSLVELGELKQRVLWAHDSKWFLQTLTYELVGAPEFVTVATTFKVTFYGIWQTIIRAQPTAPEHIGVHEFTVRVSDGDFVDEIPMVVDVRLGNGYVVWTPPGAFSAGGTALAAAITANGEYYQSVTSLDEVADWTTVQGLLVTTGAGDFKAVLTPEAVAPAVTYLEGGGSVYLEGSSTFANDPQTPLHAWFKAEPLAYDTGVLDDTVNSTQFMYPLSFGYTTSPLFAPGVDQLTPTIGSGATLALLDNDENGLAVAYEDGATGARTFASTLLTGFLVENGAANTRANYIAKVLDFFANGSGGCALHAQCIDGDPCTSDLCVSTFCQNNAIECDICLSDADCAEGTACNPKGECVELTGLLIDFAEAEGATFNCDTTDERVQYADAASGFEADLTSDVTAKLNVFVGPDAFVGDLRVTLSHAGQAVVLLEPDPSDTRESFSQTFGVKGLPASGSLDDFDGTRVGGAWVLVVENVNGGSTCDTVVDFDVYVQNSAGPQCLSNADCDNLQLCDGVETCAAGVCQPGTPEACDDGNTCTTDVCDPFAGDYMGACDHTGRLDSCDGQACAGTSDFNVGDVDCGNLDACIDGVCESACPTCVPHATGMTLTEVPNFGCALEVIEVSSGDSFVKEVHLRLDVAHANPSELRVNLISPDNSVVPLLDGDATGTDGVHATFYRSIAEIAPSTGMCPFTGLAPDGLWKVQVCDDAGGMEGVLESAVLHLATSNIDPAIGQSCSNPVPMDSADGTVMVGNNTKCYADSTEGSCTGGDGHDVVYAFDVAVTKRVTVNLDSEFDHGVFLTQNCAPGSNFCADAGGVSETETIDTQLDPGTWYLVVDAASAAQWGAYTLEVTFQTPSVDGDSCDELLDCASLHCQNGFCCSGGDCCDLPGSCPVDTYVDAPLCDDNTICEGFRVDATCVDNVCGSVTVNDDTACDPGTESDDCGLYASVFCTGDLDQVDPQCPTSCSADDQCDAGTHCFEDLSDCRVDLTNGLECARDAHCASGSCVDGVCCESACDGLCQQCNKPGFLGQCTFRQQATDPEDECAGTGLCGGTCDGAGACEYTADTVACSECTRCDGAGFCSNFAAPNTDPDDSCDTCNVCSGGGACVPAANGSDPLSECAQQPASTCGFDGECDGSGECRLWVTGTECMGQSCTDGYVDPPHTCDGLGSCVDHDDTFCEGHICLGYECMESCVNDGLCITGYFCETASGSCEPKKANGQLCGADNECQTNHCTDGVCCDAACGGPCQACNLAGSEGACVQHSAFTDPENLCGNYWCDGAASCNTTCTTDVDCKGGFWCDGTICQPKKSNGLSCSTGNQCSSGHCNTQDGVCCDTACDSLCESCKVAGSVGQCQFISAGLDPADECNGTGQCGGTCNGAGACAFPPTTLSCGTCQRCNGGGECLAVAADTDPDNTCGNCQTCNGVGSCKMVPNGQDIHNDCATEVPNTCGFNGMCDGTGDCGYYGNETISVPQSCSNGTVYFADRCDGTGGSNDGGSASCGAYACGGNACNTTCTSHSMCAANAFCDFGDVDGDGNSSECLLKKNSGLACNSGNHFECAAGYCNNGFCCNSPTGDCCASASSCSHLTSSPVCDSATGCDGHRVDAVCDGNKVCQTVTVADHSACEGLTCVNSSCSGLNFTNKTTCNAVGNCAVGGDTVSCDDGNLCTDDSCNASSGCQNPNNSYQRTCYTGGGTAGVGICHQGIQTCSGGSFGSCTDHMTPKTETCSNPDGKAYELEGQHYRVPALQMTWSDARTWCSDAGGYLATINSAAENNFLKDKVGSQSWIGFNDLASEGQYLWDGRASGLGNTYTNWYGTEPNNANNQDCVTLRSDGGWSDLSCAATHWPVCEFDGDPNDQDCDGTADEQNASGCTNYNRDSDGDGYGVNGNTQCWCAPTGIYDVINGSDCDDSNANANPGKPELCSTNFDDDCNDGINENGANGCTTYYRDNDNDGYGVSSLSQCRCSPANPYDATSSGDCNDGNSSIKPNGTEKCNNIDDDCDGSTDEDSATAANMCGSRANGTSTCSGGACGITCYSHYFNFDGNLSNGCEVVEDQCDRGVYTSGRNGDTCASYCHLRVGASDTTHDDSENHNWSTTGNLSGDGTDYWRLTTRDHLNFGQNYHTAIWLSGTTAPFKYDIYRTTSGTCQTLQCNDGKSFNYRGNFNWNGSAGQQNCAEQASRAHCNNKMSWMGWSVTNSIAYVHFDIAVQRASGYGASGTNYTLNTRVGNF